MFWKIFAWINLIINLPLSLVSIVVSISSTTPFGALMDVVVFLLNDSLLLIFPFLLAYKIYDFKYMPNILFMKMALIFMILYNITHISSALAIYNFTSVPGLLIDMSFYVLIILSIISSVLYIMTKHKIPLSRVFLR